MISSKVNISLEEELNDAYKRGIADGMARVGKEIYKKACFGGMFREEVRLIRMLFKEGLEVKEIEKYTLLFTRKEFPNHFDELMSHIKINLNMVSDEIILEELQVIADTNFVENYIKKHKIN
jgi:hypothetical protein